jgi:phosphate transporter
MALPVSGFPNMSASSIQDPTGRNYVHVGDFLKTGIPSTMLAWVCVVCIGYPIMSAMQM